MFFIHFLMNVEYLDIHMNSACECDENSCKASYKDYNLVLYMTSVLNNDFD